MRAKLTPEAEEFLQEFLPETQERDWDYTLPERFQDSVGIEGNGLIEDKGWDYTLPKQFQY